MQAIAIILAASGAAAYSVAPRLTSAAPYRAAVNALKMQEVAIDADSKAASVLDLSNEAPPEQTRFKAISLNDLDKWAEKFPRMQEKMQDIQRSALIFPFKASPYVLEELIDWEMDDVGEDPFYRLVFPTMDMLTPEHQAKLNEAVDGADPFAIKEAVDEIRESLNPHPAGQKTLNAPKKEDLTGVQHKYSETVLFFAAAAQTCHAYCTYVHARAASERSKMPSSCAPCMNTRAFFWRRCLPP